MLSAVTLGTVHTHTHTHIIILNNLKKELRVFFSSISATVNRKTAENENKIIKILDLS